MRVSKAQNNLVHGLPLDVAPKFHPYTLTAHRHEFTEMVVVIGGEATHSTMNEDHLISSGDTFIIPQGQPHAYKNPKKFQLINVYFDLAQLQLPIFEAREWTDLNTLISSNRIDQPQTDIDSYERLASPIGCKLEPPMFLEVQKLLHKLNRELTAQQPGFRAMTYSIFTELLVSIFRAYRQIPVDSEPYDEIDAFSTDPAYINKQIAGKALSSDEKHDKRLAPALEYIKSNYTRQVTIERLARLSHMSTSTLNRRFRDVTGYAPIDYVKRYRILKATEFLRDSSLNITQVAGKVGFEDSNYFTRQFKNVVGLTPRTFRNNEKT